MAKVDKRLRDPKIQEHVRRIIGLYLDGELSFSQEILEEMRQLREHYIKHHSQPTIVKSIRLAYEHIEKYGTFAIDYQNDEPNEEDGELDTDLPVTLFEYYIGLLSNPTNKYNRDEIKEINILLKYSLEHDEPTGRDPEAAARALEAGDEAAEGDDEDEYED